MDVIRWGTLIYIMVCLTISTNIQAQENRAAHQKQVRITNTLFSIDSLSTLITVQTGVFLSFNSNKVAAGKKIVTQRRSYAVEELLELIRSNTGSDYKMYKDHVIFHGGDKKHAPIKETIPSDAKRATVQTASKYKTSESSAGTTKTNASSAAKKAGTNTISPDKSKLSSAKSAVTKETKPLSAAKTNSSSLDKSSRSSTITIAETKLHTAFVDKTNAKSSATTETKETTFSQSSTNQNTTTDTKDTIFSQSSPKSSGTTETQNTTSSQSPTNPNTVEIKTKNTPSFPLEPLKPKAPQMLKPSITLLLTPAIMAQRPIPSPPRTRWFADGGFTVDDVLYLNASITAGHKYLHGFFSWSSSFKVSGFRYGLGSMIPLNNEWRIGMMVTTGKLSRNIDFSAIRDTLKNINVKSELHRLALQVEKSLRPNLVVKAGPVFNLLKSSYFQDGTPVTVATSGYEGTNGDREFYTVRPLYTLSNSYKDTESTNTKTWIGFQVSLCYRFNF
ncbi:hypothetical protein AAHN97_04985 [Chitinophaga niabensis]|uniref:hypothetical protein n=1 Tax=Chitinophaga niabensis TaxID=536979 RepID=UPI0031BA025F